MEWMNSVFQKYNCEARVALYEVRPMGCNKKKVPRGFIKAIDGAWDVVEVLKKYDRNIK